MTRESLLAKTFVELADSLVDKFDVVELLSLLADRCVEVLGATAAGLMLASPQGELRAVAFSSETARVVEVFEVQARDGPCWECFATGAMVTQSDLAGHAERWPRFAPFALAAGFASVQAVPMRLRGRTIGALSLLGAEPAGLTIDDVVAAQALADVATIAILQHRAASEAQALTEQLNLALTTRIAIEQAKGILAERSRLDMDEAFTRLRRYARNHGRLLADVARDLVAGRLRNVDD